jgi:hypothetical protein
MSATDSTSSTPLGGFTVLPSSISSSGSYPCLGAGGSLGAMGVRFVGVGRVFGEEGVSASAFPLRARAVAVCEVGGVMFPSACPARARDVGAREARARVAGARGVAFLTFSAPALIPVATFRVSCAAEPRVPCACWSRAFSRARSRVFSVAVRLVPDAAIRGVFFGWFSAEAASDVPADLPAVSDVPALLRATARRGLVRWGRARGSAARIPPSGIESLWRPLGLSVSVILANHRAPALYLHGVRFCKSMAPGSVRIGTYI